MGAKEKVAEVRELLGEINRLEGVLVERVCDAKFARKGSALASRLGEDELSEVERCTGLKIEPLWKD